MDPVTAQIGGAMGWLIEKATERKRTLSKAGAIAAQAWKLEPKGSLGSQEALANRLRDLDRGDALEWWTGEKGDPYRSCVATVLGVSPAELLSWIEDSRPALDDESRYFRFEVFPRLRALDLDTEPPYPGIPALLVTGDGATSPTWWHAPQGAGRTMVGRWLARRHGWALRSDASDLAERAWVELDAEPPGDVAWPRRVVIASPQRMPEAWKKDGWTEVSTGSGWELRLLEWASARVEAGGQFSTAPVVAALRAGRLAVATPGQLIEILADVDQLGPGVLTGSVPAERRLEAWVHVHPARRDRATTPASREYLRQHGAALLTHAERHRRVNGLDVSPDTVRACLPELEPASADAIRAAHDDGDVERALALIRPRPDALVASMRDLGWFNAGGWNFPTRVLACLHACVANAAADGGDAAELGRLADSPGMASAVIEALATGRRAEAWIERLASLDALEPEVALGIDSVVIAVALRRARARPVADASLAVLRSTVLRLARGADVGLSARGPGGPQVSSLAWLVLFPPSSPPSDVDRRRVGTASQVLRSSRGGDPWDDWAPLLAAGVLGEIAAADASSYRDWLPASAVADLARGREPTQHALAQLRQVRRLDVAERLCKPWASTLQEAARLLWPTWLVPGVPEDPDPERLAQAWSVFPGDAPEGSLPRQLVEHARRGVTIPDRLWGAILQFGHEVRDLLEVAPEDAVFARAAAHDPDALAAAWRRAPSRALGVVEGLVAVKGDVGSWLWAAPEDQTLEVLKLVQGAPDPLRHGNWADEVIARRGAGWREVWGWKVATTKRVSIGE